MTKKRTGINTLAYMGVEATSPPNSIVADVDPTSEDVAGFDLGSFWITRKSRNVWVMVSKAAGEATWGKLYPDAGGAISFPCDLGTATQVGGVLDVKGDGTSVSTSGAGSQVTIGLSTNVTIAGTLTLSVLGAGIVYSAATGLLSAKNSVNNGEVLISSSTGEPAWSTLAAGANIGIYEAANAIGIEVTGIIPIARGGTNVNNMLNTFGINYFDGTSIATTAVGTATHVLTSNGAGVAPTFQGPSTGYIWTNVTGATQTMVASHGYIAGGILGHVDFTFPTAASSSYGDVIAISGGAATTWKATGPGNTLIYFQSDTAESSISLGTTGYIESNHQFDSVEFVCVVKGTVPSGEYAGWNVRNAVGNLTLTTV